MIKKILISVAVLGVATSAAFANGNGKADHVAAWHNTGDDHQDNNEPGDTAADRHNFGNDTAGGSDTNPTTPKGK